MIEETTLLAIEAAAEAARIRHNRALAARSEIIARASRVRNHALTAADVILADELETIANDHARRAYRSPATRSLHEAAARARYRAATACADAMFDTACAEAETAYANIADGQDHE